MPTFERLPRFDQDYPALTAADRKAFRQAAEKFVADLASRGSPGVYELTWAPNGRATFSYGRSIVGDEPRVVWRRVGTHDVVA